jgi:hypothetical protein
MTAPATTRSTYPTSIDALMPKAQRLATRLGEVPSRNRLMKEFRVGSPKATALREALTATHVPTPPEPPPPDPVPADINPTVSPPADADLTNGLSLRNTDGHPDTHFDLPEPATVANPGRRPVAWPVLLLALPAFVAIWAGWVELGRLTGFGKVNLLPGIAGGWVIDTAITLPIGVETYAAYALWVWLSGTAPAPARRFAKWSAVASLGIGAAGQITYHLMAAAGWTAAPWQITSAVACLPVAVLGMGAALAHLLHTDNQ